MIEISIKKKKKKRLASFLEFFLFLEHFRKLSLLYIYIYTHTLKNFKDFNSQYF